MFCCLCCDEQWQRPSQTQRRYCLHNPVRQNKNIKQKKIQSSHKLTTSIVIVREYLNFKESLSYDHIFRVKEVMDCALLNSQLSKLKKCNGRHTKRKNLNVVWQLYSDTNNIPLTLFAFYLFLRVVLILSVINKQHYCQSKLKIE